MTTQAAQSKAALKDSIVHHALECEAALRDADIADAQAGCGEKVSGILRLLAGYHSMHAFIAASALSGAAA